MRSLRSRAWLAALSLFSLSSVACETKRAAESAAPAPAQAALRWGEREATALAQAALAPFKKELKETLTKALVDGPAAAVFVCAGVAPQLAKRASSERVVVGRSALRLRNPENAPKVWLKPLIEEFARLPSAQGQHRVVPIEQGRYGYAEAIVLQPPCLLCHGREVAPDLAAQIAARYPSDQATGFDVGQLRGVFWAEVAATTKPSEETK